MPRRGGRPWNQGNGGRFSSGNYIDEHDDRDRKPQNSKRRVSFKPSGGGRERGMHKGRLELAIKTRLEDDEEMIDTSTSKFRSDTFDKNRRKGSPIPKNKTGYKKLAPASFGWYQVTIPYGSKYDKDLIIRNILNAISPDIFVPHYWKQDRTWVTFYLDDIKMAERLLNIDRTIPMPDGFKMAIKVRSGVPVVNVDDALKERMKTVMAKRYNAATKALDLSKFHADPDLKDVFCGLFRPSILIAVIDILRVNIPDLEALNLNENMIHHLDTFLNIEDKIPNLKILYLADNRIANITHLQVFKKLPIVELALKNNPLRARYRQETIYISEIRRRFPKLAKLDGKELEPEIVFDVVESISLPSATASFLCDVSGANIIRNFLEQYFMIFDSDNRQPLLDAYHENAILSVSLPSASQAGKSSNFHPLANYWRFNRNILKGNDTESKFRLIRYGRLPAVSLLSELPKTKHELQTFSADLTLFTPKLICFTISGIFKELTSGSSESANPQIRSFQRFFVIVPAGSGFCIRNEMIFITNPTQSQVKMALKPPVATPPITPSNIAAPVPSTSQGQPNVPVVPDETTKIQMIQAMSNRSNMNLEWSRKCLEETNWDFNHAAYVFDSLHKENRIPAQAFIK